MRLQSAPQKAGPGHELLPKSYLTRACGCPGQRHFCVFAVSFPGQEALTTIYNSILSQHLAFCSAPTALHRMGSQLVALALGKRASLAPLLICTSFIVSPARYFIYIFKSILFKQCCVSTGDMVKSSCLRGRPRIGNAVNRKDLHVKSPKLPPSSAVQTS